MRGIALHGTSPGYGPWIVQATQQWYPGRSVGAEQLQAWKPIHQQPLCQSCLWPSVDVVSEATSSCEECLKGLFSLPEIHL